MILTAMTGDSSHSCSWCGRALDADDSWLLADPAGDRGAGFCRLEHVVPWAIRGPRWDPAAPRLEEQPDVCSHCGEALADGRLVLLRRRGGHTFTEGFCSLDHLSAWARAGGPWGRSGGA